MFGRTQVQGNEAGPQLADGQPSGLNSFFQVIEVKLGRVRSNSGWVTSEV